MKDTGKSLFGGDDTPNEEALKQEITDLGLEAEGVDISVEGDQVKISGKGLSAEAQEKVILAVGNVAGVASVESDIKDEPNFHTVEKGDTLSAVAKKTLGNANRYHEIFEANKPMLSHPDKIYPGQVLRIPTK